ncbi:hypothetical protein AbraIFM66950_011851, partial [Aspergillus brasiliensis]
MGEDSHPPAPIMSIKRALSKIKPSKSAPDDESSTSTPASATSMSPRRSILSNFLRDRDYASSSDDGSDDSSPSSISKNQQKRLARKQRKER